jgi:hypothetical protein
LPLAPHPLLIISIPIFKDLYPVRGMAGQCCMYSFFKNCKKFHTSVTIHSY